MKFWLFLKQELQLIQQLLQQKIASEQNEITKLKVWNIPWLIPASNVCFVAPFFFIKPVIRGVEEGGGISCTNKIVRPIKNGKIRLINMNENKNKWKGWDLFMKCL